MLKLLKIVFATTIAVILFSISTLVAHSEEPISMASLDSGFVQVQKPSKVRNYSEPIRMANACGLCTDVDCCGGAENGWKLCKSDCAEGQYKCEQVAACK